MNYETSGFNFHWGKYGLDRKFYQKKQNLGYDMSLEQQSRQLEKKNTNKKQQSRKRGCGQFWEKQRKFIIDAD